MIQISRRNLLLVLVVVGLVAGMFGSCGKAVTGPATAENGELQEGLGQDTSDLEARVSEFESELSDLEDRVCGGFGCPTFGSLRDDIDDLDSRVSDLEYDR